jgi:hypothetical protein
VSGRPRRIEIVALVAAAALLVALLLTGGDRPSKSEARAFDLDFESIEFVFPEYQLVPPSEPWTPSTLPRGMRRHEKDYWMRGYRTCRRPWHELVAEIGLTGVLPSSRPESEEQLEWLAWRILHQGPGLDLTHVNTNNFNYGVQGCVDGFNSDTGSPAARGGVDARP